MLRREAASPGRLHGERRHRPRAQSQAHQPGVAAGDDERACVDHGPPATAGAEGLAYEKLLPLGFHVFQLAENVQNVNDHSHPPDPRQYVCGGTYYPWYYYPSPLAWTSLLQSYDPVGHDNSYEIFVLSVPPGANTYHGTPPDVATLTRMFGPVAKSNEVGDGGLDISPVNMMRSATHDGWTGQGPGGDSCVFLG